MRVVGFLNQRLSILTKTYRDQLNLITDNRLNHDKELYKNRMAKYFL